MGEAGSVRRRRISALPDESAGRNPVGLSLPRREARLAVHGEEDSADVRSCAAEGALSKLLPHTTSSFHDGLQDGGLARAVRTDGYESASGVEVAECVFDVLDIVAVRKRWIHKDAVEHPEVSILF